MYAFKQLVALFTAPMSVVLLLMGLALLLGRLQRPRAAKGVALGAAALLYLCSIMPVANLLLGSLEVRTPGLYASLVDAPAPRFVVVLGSGFQPHGELPVTSQLDPDGLARVVEGVRLWRQHPEATLVLTGGAPAPRLPSARGYRELALGLGVPDASIVVIDTPLDTASEARALTAVAGDEPLLLVTSAFHMRRALGYARLSGLQAVPAPTAHRVIPDRPWSWRSLVPNGEALRRTEFAVHEYLGLLAQTVTGA